MARAMPGPGRNEVALILEEAEIYALRDLLDETLVNAAQSNKLRQSLWLKKGILDQIRRVLYQSPRRAEDNTPPSLEKTEAVPPTPSSQPSPGPGQPPNPSTAHYSAKKTPASLSKP